MCDIRTFNRIEKAIGRQMAAGQMFTAFDITLALQKRGLRKLHHEIRRDIKRVADVLMWRFGYERTLVSFKEIGASAFVYHPRGTDASLHLLSTGPRALAQANGRKRIAAVRGRARPGAGQDRQSSSYDVFETDRVLGIVSALFIIVKDRGRDLN